MSNKKKTSSDLQGIARIVTDATIGITDLVEAMHRRIVHPPFLPSTPVQHLISGIAGVAFNGVKRGAQLVGSGTDKALGMLDSVLGETKTTTEKEAVRSVLNGIVGDYLEENENPLQITMQFRTQGKTISLDSESLTKAFPNITGKILVLVHGSCMNDIQWTRKEHNHGTALAEDLQKTPVYLHYNSGRHISTNGQDLSNLLEDLLNNWPVPVTELTVVAHSMGGLVTRSAVYYGQQENKSWASHLKKIVFLGTPHHGASLERAGNYLDVILEAIPYAKPFARLGKIRSAGVTDLRYGNLLEQDRKDSDRFKLQGDQRQHVALPKQVECYSIAGVVGKTKKPVSSKFAGDKLVSLKSAMGQHKNPDKNLDFKEENTWIAYGSSHLDLLNNADIYSKIKEWLT